MSRAFRLDLPRMLAQKDEAVDGLTKGVEFSDEKEQGRLRQRRGKNRRQAGKVEVTGEGGG